MVGATAARGLAGGAILAAVLAGSADADPYGGAPARSGKPPSSVVPGRTHVPTVPRTPVGRGIPPSVLDRTAANAARIQRELDGRIEAAGAAELEAYRNLQSAYAAIGPAEDRERDRLRDYLHVRGWEDYDGADPYHEIVPNAEAEYEEARERVVLETELLQEALDDYEAARAERQELEALRDAAPALGDLLGPSAGSAAAAADAGSPDADPPPTSPPSDPDPTPEQRAHAAYRQALGNFADGNATFEDVEAAYADLTAARTAAGW